MMCYSFILPSDPNLHANRWMNPRFKILSEIKDIETIASDVRISRSRG